jgi:uncharacterized protein
MNGAPRPRPQRTSETAFFWDGVDRGELRIQQCGGCGVLSHPPRAACPECGALASGWVVASGNGTIHSYATHHHPPVPGPAAPFDVILVDLDEGVRIISNLVGCEPGTVEIGQRVAVRFVEVEPGLVVPLFAPAA